MGDPFDVIPFDVGPLSLLNIQYLFAQHRISKAAGQSWVQAPLEMYTRVRETPNIICNAHPTVGSYLGIQVAIKEVLPSTEYDVAKYFEREWRLLKSVPLLPVFVTSDSHPGRESRHPNVVLYLGLSRAPDPDGRIFIISEFIENGMRSLV